MLYQRAAVTKLRLQRPGQDGIDLMLQLLNFTAISIKRLSKGYNNDTCYVDVALAYWESDIDQRKDSLHANTFVQFVMVKQQAYKQLFLMCSKPSHSDNIKIVIATTYFQSSLCGFTVHIHFIKMSSTRNK